MNSITELLNLEDADIFISNISINGTKKILTLETKPIRHFCPVCGFKMYSRGIKVRTINHPVLQDGYELVLKSGPPVQRVVCSRAISPCY